jgi:hypothetical protein
LRPAVAVLQVRRWLQEKQNGCRVLMSAGHTTDGGSVTDAV